MASFIPTNEETLEDQRLYTEARMAEVACLDCLVKVGVKKNSDHHTSIQWSGNALTGCPEFGKMEAAPGGRPVRQACPRLTSSIEQAVRDGAIAIGAEDGY